MTDIEKKAREYALGRSGIDERYSDFTRLAYKGFSGFDLGEAFDAGAAYALSNQWHDAEKETPKYGERVLIMSENDEYPAFGEWYGDYWEREDADVINRSNDEYYPFKVIAWLEIPEYKPNGE